MSRCCRGCEKRYLGCHDHCEDYKAFKAEIEERKEREKRHYMPFYVAKESSRSELERKRKRYG